MIDRANIRLTMIFISSRIHPVSILLNLTFYFNQLSEDRMNYFVFLILKDVGLVCNLICPLVVSVLLI